MVANLACYWAHCEWEWSAQWVSCIFKSLRAEHGPFHGPFHRSSDSSFACCFSLKAGLHSGRLWTTSRACPQKNASQVISPQASAACGLALPFFRDMFSIREDQHQQSPTASKSPGLQHGPSSATVKPPSLGSGRGANKGSRSRYQLMHCHYQLPSPALWETEGKENAQGHGKIMILSTEPQTICFLITLFCRKTGIACSALRSAMLL